MEKDTNDNVRGERHQSLEQELLPPPVAGQDEVILKLPPRKPQHPTVSSALVKALRTIKIPRTAHPEDQLAMALAMKAEAEEVLGKFAAGLEDEEHPSRN